MKRSTLLLLSTLFIAPHAWSQTGRGLEFSGSMLADAGLYHFVQENHNDSAEFSGTARFSLRFRNANRRYGKVEGDFDLVLPYGASAKYYLAMLHRETHPFDTSDSLARVIAEQVTSTVSRTVELFTGGKTPLLLDLRELYLAFYLPFVDVSLGRRIINFGKGFVFSPIDVFSAVQITDIDLRRSGSDVANLRFPLGPLAGVDCVVEAPFLDGEHSTALKAFATLRDWDFSLIGIYRHRSEEVIAGMTFKGDAFLGVYGELVEHIVDGLHEQYIECMLGTDYSISTRWFFSLEYLYKDRSTDMLSLWGRNNLYASVQFQPNELVGISGLAIHQFEDARSIGMLRFSYNLLQNTDMSVYVRRYSNMEDIGAPDVEYAMRVEVAF